MSARKHCVCHETELLEGMLADKNVTEQKTSEQVSRPRPIKTFI